MTTGKLAASRASFEAWYSGDDDAELTDNAPSISDMDAHHRYWMFAAWQASRKAALEDTAKAIASVCSEQATDWGDGYNQGAILCEIKVRNLL